jgi:hypothetical protein
VSVLTEGSHFGHLQSLHVKNMFGKVDVRLKDSTEFSIYNLKPSPRYAYLIYYIVCTCMYTEVLLLNFVYLTIFIDEVINIYYFYCVYTPNMVMEDSRKM